MSLATRVREVMTPDPQVISPDKTLERAYAVMKEEGFRHLPVVQDGVLIGILSMTDIGHLGASVPELMARTVGSLMTKNPLTVGADEPIEAAAAQMGIRKVHCLPVVEADKLVGIITTYDLLDALARHFGPKSNRTLPPDPL
jgi:acetoin utilization protein AcuB